MSKVWGFWTEDVGEQLEVMDLCVWLLSALYYVDNRRRREWSCIEIYEEEFGFELFIHDTEISILEVVNR